MSKISNIMEFLEAGIKAEGLRQKAIANNVANIETPAYRRLDVKFEQLLAKALDSPGDIDIDKIKAQLYQPQSTPLKPDGNDVNLEAEVGQMVKNSLRHKAFVRLLYKKYRQMELAMSEK